MAKPCVIYIQCLYLAKLNPVLRIGYIHVAKMVERRNDDQYLSRKGPALSVAL